ncbi:hypothetical protein [Cetobacterium sp.]|uniref:hypothetical protein n=1 Tax=Cetobacterium sp. TaxID=2071632 RepID=UPI003F2E8AAD
MKVYAILVKRYNEEFKIIEIFDNLKKALERSKIELKTMIKETYDSEEYNLNKEYKFLVKYKEVSVEDLGELKIVEKEVV